MALIRHKAKAIKSYTFTFIITFVFIFIVRLYDYCKVPANRDIVLEFYTLFYRQFGILRLYGTEIFEVYVLENLQLF